MKYRDGKVHYFLFSRWEKGDVRWSSDPYCPEDEPDPLMEVIMSGVYYILASHKNCPPPCRNFSPFFGTFITGFSKFFRFLVLL